MLKNAIRVASDQKVIVSGASRVGIANARWPFLPATSKVLGGHALHFISTLFDNSTPTSSDVDELSDYLVLASCCHTLDGWRYLSQAAITFLNGSKRNALHYAYYAELRAALSILAGSGICIAHDKHYAISSGNRIEWFRGSTHDITWLALQRWAKQPIQAAKVIDCFTAYDITAREWGEACRNTLSLNDIASNWLSNWSIDLSQLSIDRNLRNDVSYNPDLGNDSFAPITRHDIEFIRDLSDSFNLKRSGSFESLDNVIIYDLLNKICLSRYSDVTRINQALLSRDIIHWLTTNKRMNAREVAEILRSLNICSSMPASKVIKYSDLSHRDVYGVICRASLLLRLSTALNRNLWEKIRRISAGGNSPWQLEILQLYGLCTNLWDANNVPATNSDFVDIEEDRITAQDVIDQWLEDNSVFSHYKIWDEKSQYLIAMCRFERTGILALT